MFDWMDRSLKKTRREKVSQASGQLISAAFTLATELIPASDQKPLDEAIVNDLANRLSQCVDQDRWVGTRSWRQKKPSHCWLGLKI